MVGRVQIARVKRGSGRRPSSTRFPSMVYQPYPLTPFFTPIAIPEFVSMRVGVRALQASVRNRLGQGCIAILPYRFSAERTVGSDERSRNLIERPRDTKIWPDSGRSEGPIRIQQIQERSCEAADSQDRRDLAPLAWSGAHRYLTRAHSRARPGQPENRAGMLFVYRQLATVYATDPDWLKAESRAVLAARCGPPCPSSSARSWGTRPAGKGGISKLECRAK
jgi:hypothetical protein